MIRKKVCTRYRQSGCQFRRRNPIPHWKPTSNKLSWSHSAYTSKTTRLKARIKDSCYTSAIFEVKLPAKYTSVNNKIKLYGFYFSVSSYPNVNHWTTWTNLPFPTMKDRTRAIPIIKRCSLAWRVALERVLKRMFDLSLESRDVNGQPW